MSGLLNGNRNGIVAKMIAGIIVFLIGQGIALGIWLVQLGDRMANVESHQAEIDRRMNSIDDHGTRRLGVIERVQEDVVKRLDRLENRQRP